MTSDNPPYFQVGTNVSARYKGAFCSANVKKVKRKVKVKVQFLCKPRPKLRSIMDDEVFGPLHVNSKVRAIDPDVGGLCDAIVVQVIDRSVYTVVFNDGDVSTLTRSGVCTPGQRHYNAKDNLDNFPLLDPKEFSSPVVAGSQQVPTERVNRRLPRTQTIDNVPAVPSVRSDTLSLIPEIPSTEAHCSSVVRSCRQKNVVASSSNVSLQKKANRPKVLQRKTKQTTKKIPAVKLIRRKVLGYKKNLWRTRKMTANGTAQKANGYGPSKLGRPKIRDLTEPAILEVINDIKRGARENDRKISTAGSSILRFPITGGQRVASATSPESIYVRPLFKMTKEENASKRKALSVERTIQVPNGEMNGINEKNISNCDEEEEHDVIDGSDQETCTGNKEVQVLDTPSIDLKPNKTEPAEEERRPCCSRELRKVESSIKSRDTVFHRRNTRATANAFPKTVNDMYKELCVIVDQKKVEVPTVPPVGKQFNFVPENLELVTDPKERQRMIMMSLENLCVTYFGIKEHISVVSQLTSKPKKK